MPMTDVVPENSMRHRLEAGGAASFWSLLLAAVLVFHLGLFLLRNIVALEILVQATSYLQLAIIRTTLILFFEVTFSLSLLVLIGLGLSKTFKAFFKLDGLHRKVFAGAMAGILLFVVTELFYRVNGFGLNDISNVSIFFKYADFPVLLGRVLKHLTIPFGEELFFRGVLFTALSLRFSTSKALIISSLIFSASHLNPTRSFLGEEFIRYIGFFINGCVYCFLFKKHKDLFPSIAAHSTFNLLTSFFYLN